MSTVVIVGAQWGDEGKGKVIDFLASEANVVVRGQGGNNAGHTVVVGDNKYALHLVPSGILYPETINVIGNGIVFDPEGFIAEIDKLEVAGINTDNIRISDRAHVILPYHKKIDELSELARGENKIGTTKKGIGPCYMDKVERSGIRICDLMDKKIFADKLKKQVAAKNEIIEKIYNAEKLDYDEILNNYLSYRERIKKYVEDTTVTVYDNIKAGKKVLFEGAQGSLLDIDLGTYPYVTSSHPTAGGFTVGAGIGPNMINEVLGITKSYSTRVGMGPFVTEEDNETGDKIRIAGNEFGTTTGRPRRCGWLDMVLLKYSMRINGMTSIAFTLLDVLTGFEEIKICVGYKHGDEIIEHYPASLELLSECKPVYETLKGWTEDISDAKSFEELPVNAQNYINRIEEITGIPVKFISVGPKRSQSIVREAIYK